MMSKPEKKICKCQPMTKCGCAGWNRCVDAYEKWLDNITAKEIKNIIGARIVGELGSDAKD